MSKLLFALWQKIKHPVRTEAAILFAVVSGALVAGGEYLGDHVADLHLNGATTTAIALALAAILTRFKVWSAKTVDEIEGGDEPHPESVEPV